MKRPARPAIFQVLRPLAGLALSAAFAGMVTLPGSRATASIFGADERVPLPQSLQKAGAKLGLFFDKGSHSVCTAFCVAPDVILTAAHCLYRTSGQQPLRLNDLSFKLHGVSQAVKIAGADTGAPEANVSPGSTQLNVHPPIDATRDWAIVRLAQRVCTAGVFKVKSKPVDEVMRLASSGRVYNLAYHRDLPKWQPMLNAGCNVKRSFDDADWPTIKRDFSNPEQLLLHTCDTGAASSGSPLLIDGADGPEVIGINVGTYVQSKVIMLNGEVLHRFKSDDVANTGVNALAFSPALDAFLSAETLRTRHDVRRLQDALAARGLYTGPRDGVYGPALRTAITTFERASLMRTTGLATRALLQALTVDNELVTGKIPSATTSAATGTR